MAKKVAENLIEKEIGNFQEKLEEFQRYLKDNSVLSDPSGNGDPDMVDDDQDFLHKEILIQIKMQDAILFWLPLLKKLRETQEDKQEVRGDTNIGGSFRNKLDS